MEKDFYNNTMKYSTVKYLQKKVMEKLLVLPEDFKSLNEWEKYKVKLISDLKTILPVWEPAGLQEDCITAKADLKGNLVLESIDVCVEDGYYAPVHLYRKKNNNKCLPVVMVCPGYGQPKNAKDIADVCIELASSGIMAVSVEYGGTGECSDRPDVSSNINNVTALALMIGISDVGIRVMHNLSVLRYLKTRNDVDNKRIGITGICQGSIALWYTAAICSDFKAISPLCGTSNLMAEALEYTNRQGGWAGTSPFVHNHLEYCDIQHIYGCFAPRPLFVQNNIIDRHWPYSGLEKVKEMTEKIYGLYNAGDKYEFRIEHEPHAYAGKFISNLVKWFSYIFKVDE